MAEIEAWFPRKAEFLFRPQRYKVIHGGRGGGKSWSVARALLIQAIERPLRILCTREVQKSIKQSVHQLLRDQIEALGLTHLYEVLDAEIRGKNGTLFMFAGLSDLTAEALKSYEGVDICWCEEGHSISRRSWQILTPTIRKQGSEIWVTFNPDLDTDETYVRFVKSPPPDCTTVELNWSDNARFPDTLNRERIEAQAKLPEHEYAWIWEGKCRPSVDGAIYANEMAKFGGRLTLVPHDPTLKTHAIWDMGFNDAMAITLAQRVAGEVRVIAYLEGNQRTLASYSEELRELRLDGFKPNWGTMWLPHDAFAVKHQTGRSDAKVMESLGWTVRQTPNIPVEQGINRAREMLPRTYIHKERAARLVECLKRYRRAINRVTRAAGDPVHDEWSHGSDTVRYLAVVEPELTNDEWGSVNGPVYTPASIV